jgi:hypothetical protein
VKPTKPTAGARPSTAAQLRNSITNGKKPAEPKKEETKKEHKEEKKVEKPAERTSTKDPLARINLKEKVITERIGVIRDFMTSTGATLAEVMLCLQPGQKAKDAFIE